MKVLFIFSMKYWHLKHHIQVVHSFYFPLHSLNTLLHNLLREKIVRLSNYFVIQMSKKHGFLLFFHLLDISSQLWSWVAAVLDCFTLPVYLFCYSCQKLFALTVSASDCHSKSSMSCFQVLNSSRLVIVVVVVIVTEQMCLKTFAPLWNSFADFFGQYCHFYLFELFNLLLVLLVDVGNISVSAW